MESRNFNLQIDMFVTNTDEWENQNEFWCVFNGGSFRDAHNGNCLSWEDKDWWHLGKVEKNRYNSYDLVLMSNKIYKTDDEALKALEEIETQN